MSAKKEHLYALDTLKGIMIFAIVLYHMPSYMRGFPSALNVFYTYGGDVGNTVFFMLSGFTLCYSYVDRVQELTLREFVKKRVLSVYAIYVITNAISLFFAIRNNGIGILNIRDLALNVLMITSGWVENIYPYNVPTWFFSALLLDYVIWFIIAKNGGEKKWCLFVFMILLGLAIQKMCLEKPFLYYHTGEAIVPFFEGCILNKYWQEKREQGKQLLPVIGVLSTLLVLSIVLTYIEGFDTAVGTWKYAWYVIYAPLILLAVLDIKWINKWFSSRAMVGVFGNISKYIFFWHAPFFSMLGGVLQKIFPNSANTMLIVYLITLYIFCTVYRLLEKKMRSNWRGRLT